MSKTKAEKPLFLFLFRNPVDSPDPSPEEMEKIFGKWMEWMKSMNAKGQFVGANRLNDAGKTMRGPRGATVTDGPFVETKEMVGGYVLAAADNLAQAVEIARGCPGLDYDIAVEVRPVEQMPPI